MELSNQFKFFLQMYCPLEITDWSIFDGMFETYQIKKGQTFIKAGDQTDYLGIVNKGLFASYLIDKNGKKKTTSFTPEGDILANEVYIFARKTAYQTSEALEDSELYVTRFSRIEALLNTSIEVNHIYRNLLQKVFIRKYHREATFIQLNATERLINLKEDLNTELNRIPKSHLASYLGIIPQTFSRLLSTLREQGNDIYRDAQ